MKKESDEYLSISAEDLNLYFRQTYIRVLDSPNAPPAYRKEAGKYFYCRGFEGNRGNKIVTFSGQGGAFGAWSDHVKEIQLNFSFPENGAYNFKDSVVLVSRKTERQNKKGLCGGTHDVFNVSGLLHQIIPISATFLMHNNWRWSCEAVNQTFDRQGDYNIVEAFRDVIQCKSLARSLGGPVYITAGISSENPSVWYNKLLLGVMDNPETITVTNPALYQEAKDFFRDKGVDIRV